MPDGLLSSGLRLPQLHKSGAAQTICVTVDGKVVVGRRLHHRAGVRTGVAHTRPGQPSLASGSSVGSGMAAGAAISGSVRSSAGRRPRRRPIFFNHTDRYI